jgi:hypothetical protein
MQAVPADPRDTSWETDSPAYRVTFWTTAPGSGWSSSEWRVTDADVPEVLAWAAAEAGDRYMTVAVEADRDGRLGLIRLLGWEPTRADEPPGWTAYPGRL